jgi:hypothetical protein
MVANMSTTATDSPSSSPAEAGFPPFVVRAISVAWGLNAIVLVALVVWIWNDPQFMLRWSSDAPYPGTQTRYHLPMSPSRWATLRGGIAASSVSGTLMLAGLAIGSRRQRGLRAWLLFMTLSAGWLALAMSWRDLQWTSQTSRLGGQIAEFETLAEPLRKQWPNEDGVLPKFGPFSAYANGQARVLLMQTSLSPKELVDHGWGIATIERSPAGGLRFELEGAEDGAWIEWHPHGETPASFVGGLATTEDLRRSKPLGQGWFATRYATSPRE